jgi:hypothetical protein
MTRTDATNNSDNRTILLGETMDDRREEDTKERENSTTDAMTSGEMTSMKNAEARGLEK